MSALLSNYSISARAKAAGSKSGLQHRSTEDGWTTVPDINTLKLWCLPILAEFVGTTLLVYLDSMSFASGCTLLPISSLLALLGGGAAGGGAAPGVGLLQQRTIPPGFLKGIPICSSIGYASAVGFSVVALVGIFGHVSGAHFNPAVTLGLTLIGTVEPAKAILYIAAQIVGAIVGAAAAWGTLGQSRYAYRWSASENGLNAFTRTLDKGYHIRASTNGEFFIFEFMCALFLVLVYVGVSFDRRAPKNLAPVVIGLTYVAIASAIAVQLASGNPLFAFGAAVLYGEFSRHWLTWVGTLTGGIVGGQMYRWLFLVPEDTGVALKMPQLNTLPEQKDGNRDVSI